LSLVMNLAASKFMTPTRNPCCFSACISSNIDFCGPPKFCQSPAKTTSKTTASFAPDISNRRGILTSGSETLLRFRALADAFLCQYSYDDRNDLRAVCFHPGEKSLRDRDFGSIRMILNGSFRSPTRHP